MSFADDLRKVKPVSSQSAKIGRVQYMCQLITIDDIKRECSIQAGKGENKAVVKKDNFYTEYGTSFAVNFSKKPFFKIRKSAEEENIEKIILESLGQKAKQLGLNLDSVNCKYSSNSNAPSSYTICVSFSW